MNVVAAPSAESLPRVRASAWVFVFAVAVSLAAWTVHPALALAVLVAYLVAATADWRVSSRSLFGAFLVAVVLVPAQYRLVAQMPADVRADRIFLAILLAAWGFGLLETKSATMYGRSRRPGQALLGFAAVAVVSLLLNAPRAIPADDFPWDLKSLLMLLVLLATYFLTLRVVRSRQDAQRMAVVAVGAGGVAALTGVVEWFAGFNPIAATLLSIPGVDRARADLILERGERLRVMGTGEHPIAFGGLMAMLLPLALYLTLSRRGTERALFAVATALIGSAMFLTVSRSAIIASAVGAGVLLACWPHKRRTLVALSLALVLTVTVMAPGLLGTLQQSMRPSWVISQEAKSYSSRLGDYPLVAEIVPRQPLFGVGWAVFDARRFFYLDNQLLKVVLEVGIVGSLFALLFFTRVSALLWRTARHSAEETPFEGALLASLACFAVLSALFDTFGFSQLSQLFFIIAALGVTASADAARVGEGDLG